MIRGPHEFFGLLLGLAVFILLALAGVWWLGLAFGLFVLVALSLIGRWRSGRSHGDNLHDLAIAGLVGLIGMINVLAWVAAVPVGVVVSLFTAFGLVWWRSTRQPAPGR